MTDHAEESANQGPEVPYPPSWIDRLIIRIENLPGPAWLFYILSGFSFAVFFNLIFWIDGSVPAGTIDPVNTGIGFLLVYWLALYQYLTSIGSKSLKAYRPLLEADESEFAQINYELANLPRRLGWLSVLVGFVLAAEEVLGNPAADGNSVSQTDLVYFVDWVITSFMAATFFCVIFRSIRQLRLVGKLHARAKNINLLDLSPAHAFSGLTARTGIGVIFILVFAYLFDPDPVGTAFDVLLYAGIALLAIAIFALPIMGIRDHIEEEKERRLKEASDLLQVTSDSFHSKVGNKDYDDLGGMETAIRALIRERDLLEKISTWPWDASTIRGFATTLLLPIFLWLVTRLLERLL